MGKIKVSWRPYLVISLGCFIVTFAMNFFLIPYKLAPGGVSGLSTVIYYLGGGRVSVGLLMLIINVPLFLTGYKSRGRLFLIRSIFGAVLLSVMIRLGYRTEGGCHYGRHRSCGCCAEKSLPEIFNGPASSYFGRLRDSFCHSGLQKR